MAHLRRNGRVAGWIPLLLPVALSAQTAPGRSLPSVSPGGAAMPSAPATPPPPAPPPAPVNTLTTTPSFYGADAPAATSSLGLPGFFGTPVGEGVAQFLENPLRWGPFTAHPHLDYRFTYADGVRVRRGNPSSTALHAVSPGLSVVSRHLTLDYTPTLTYYSKGPYEDAVNHSADLRANFGYNDWFFGIAQGYDLTSQPLIETGLQTKTESHSTSLSAAWLFNEKLFFNFSLSQQFRNSQGFQNSRQWSTMNWINYRLTQAFSIGGGVGGGYVDVDRSSDMTFEQFQGRLNWHPSDKLSLSLNGGVEIRQFLDIADSEDLINPLMGAAISYRPFEFTTLSLSANRSVGSSLFTSQVVETTSVTGGISQRFLGRFRVGLNAGYRNSDYRYTFAIQNRRFDTARQDDYTFVSTSIGTTFLKRGNVSFRYMHSSNQSTDDTYTYDSDQFTFQIGYRF